MSTNDSTTPTRRCGKCQNEYPATAEYFYRDKQGKYGLSATCKICSSKRSKQWYIDNHDYAAQRIRKYNDANKERLSEYYKQYRFNHKERIRARDREYNATRAQSNRSRVAKWQLDNPDRKRKNALRWRHRNLERSRETSRRYAKEHPEKITVNSRNRRARKRNAEGSHTVADERAQFERQKRRCYYCGCEMIKEPFKPNSATVDHVVPLDQKGRNSPDNLVIACRDCNSRKGNKRPDQWTEGGRLL